MEEQRRPRPRGRKVLAYSEKRKTCVVAWMLTVGEKGAPAQGSLMVSGLGCQAKVFGCGPVGN